MNTPIEQLAAYLQATLDYEPFHNPVPDHRQTVRWDTTHIDRPRSVHIVMRAAPMMEYAGMEVPPEEMGAIHLFSIDFKPEQISSPPDQWDQLDGETKAQIFKSLRRKALEKVREDALKIMPHDKYRHTASTKWQDEEHEKWLKEAGIL